MSYFPALRLLAEATPPTACRNCGLEIEEAYAPWHGPSWVHKGAIHSEHAEQGPYRRFRCSAAAEGGDPTDNGPRAWPTN